MSRAGSEGVGVFIHQFPALIVWELPLGMLAPQDIWFALHEQRKSPGRAIQELKAGICQGVQELSTFS